MSLQPGQPGNDGYWKKGLGPWSGKKRPPMSPEWKAKIAAALVGKSGRIPSEETRKKMSLSGRMRAPMSDATKAKMSAARMGRSMNLSSEARRLRGLNVKVPKHWNWKDGKTRLSRQIRQIFEYREWRKAVYARDNHTCLKCGITGADLHADHIYPFAKILDECRVTSIEAALQCDRLWDVRNGRTLCVPCHRMTETYAKPA
jgi:5-methylcytosine-specific restriction endonuclease McrA